MPCKTTKTRGVWNSPKRIPLMIYCIYGFNRPNIRKIMKHHLNISKSPKVDALIGIYHYHISYIILHIITKHHSAAFEFRKKSGDLCGWSIGGGEVGSATFLHLRWGPRRDLHATGGGPGWDFFGGWDCSLSCWKSHISTILL